MKILGTYDPADEAGWLELRRQGLGGSDAAAIMGEDRYENALDVYNARVHPEESSGAGSGEAAYWGHMLEDTVAEEFSRRTGMAIEPIYAVLQHDRFPFMLASVDRRVMDPDFPSAFVPLEVKTRSAFVRRDWEYGVPRPVWVQVQHYCAVVDAPWAWVAVLVGGQKFMHYHVARDDEYIEHMVSAEFALWKRIELLRPPELPLSPRAIERLQGRPLAVTGKVVAIDEKTRDAIEQLREVRALAKSLDKTRDQLTAQIQVAMGDGEVAYFGAEDNVLARWRASLASGIDVGKLREEYPDVAAMCSKSSPVKRLELP